MKKLALLIFLVVLLPLTSLAQPYGASPYGGFPTLWDQILNMPAGFADGVDDGTGAVENDIYGAGWDGDITHSPTQDSIYDYLHQLDTDDDGDIDNLDPSALPTSTKSFIVYGATAADDFLLWRTPYSITITAIHGVLQSGTNVIGGLDECDGNGANPVAVDSDITFDGGLDSDDGDLTNPSIDAGDWIKWHTTSVSSPGYLTITIYFTID